MPSRKRSGAKPLSATPQDHDYVRKVCAAADPYEGATILLKALSIPDLVSRSGLKKVHDAFGHISDQLFGLLEKYRHSPQIVAAVLHIFSQMCNDSMLRNKLHQRGLVAALIPLLSEKSCRLAALQTLKRFAIPGGHVVRTEMARLLSPVLIKLMADNPDDDVLTAACLCPLGIVLSGAMDTCHRPDPELLQSLDPLLFFNLLAKILRRQSTSPSVVDDCISLSTLVGHRFPKKLRENEDLVRFFVAGLRSTRFDYRMHCLHALIAASHPGSPPPDAINTQSINDALHRVLSDAQLRRALEAYGLSRCELPKSLLWENDLNSIIQQYSEGRDIYALGIKLAGYITFYPFAPTDVPTWDPAELPFNSFPKALRFCSEKLRTMALSDADAHIPDLLETDSLLIIGRLDEAAELAERALLRSPEVAWFYYIVACASNDTERSARAAKRGIKCAITTPYVYHHLLSMAVGKGALLALDLMRATPRWQSCDAVYALYDEALRDAKIYASEASPDNHGMRTNLNWYFILLVLMQGPALPKDLNNSEIKHIEQKLEIAERFQAIWLGAANADVDVEMPTNWVRRSILKHYSSAFDEWREPVERMYGVGANQRNEAPWQPAPDLDAWLRGSITLIENYPLPSAVSLEQCSWCKNSSAVLKKCGRCSTARYCDPTCQRADWSKHKLVCVKQ